MDLMKQKTAEKWFREGNELFGKKDLDGAINAYTQVIALKPQDATAYNNRGVSYKNKGEYDKAIEDYAQAIKINPQYAEAYYNRGIAYDDKGEYDKAIEDYTKAIELNPEYAKAYYNRGNTYYKKGECDKAIEDYTKAIELEPTDATAYNNRGVSYDNKGEYDKAIEDYTKAIELDPTDATARNNRNFTYKDKGISYIKLQRIEEGVDSLKLSGLCNNVVDVYSKRLSKLTEKERDKIALLMLKDDPVYIQITQRFPIDFTIEWTNNEEFYKKLFIKSRHILSLLHVEKEAQQGVAHYTTPQTLKTLILNKTQEAKLRLHLITLSNDKSEGRALMDYLYRRCIPIEDSGIVALSASFAFNGDCLNQFRLYGKDDKREGAGVSIIMKETFFESTIKAPSDSMKMSLSTDSSITSDKDAPKDPDPYQKDRVALYRCMYIDPETQQVISLGQREEYTFYRDALKGVKNDKEKNDIKDKVEENIKEYHDEMNKLLEQVQTVMTGIVDIIEKYCCPIKPD
jgi:tetratricopeptide (TPR) repeat protein